MGRKEIRPRKAPEDGGRLAQGRPDRDWDRDRRWAEAVGGRVIVDVVPMLLRALDFAAVKHRGQLRKGVEASPYINHPIQVTRLLAEVGCVRDPEVLCAAVLHDTIEDTETTGEELETHFGARVRALVEEVTDDKDLPKEVRKRLQIEHAPRLSEHAGCVKLADKICNVRDVTHDPPAHWEHARRVKYLDWAEAVVEGVRGACPPLEEEFDRVLAEGRAHLGDPSSGDEE